MSATWIWINAMHEYQLARQRLETLASRPWHLDFRVSGPDPPWEKLAEKPLSNAYIWAHGTVVAMVMSVGIALIDHANQLFI